MVCSSSARWHWASSWLDDGEAAARCREEEEEEEKVGSEGRGMEMGELMLSLLGGEEDGLMLSEELSRKRRLLHRSRSCTFSLTQGIFSGMLRFRRSCDARRGGGGRGGGDRSAALIFGPPPVPPVSSRGSGPPLTGSSPAEGFEAVPRSPSGWCTFMKSGLMKQSAPLDWQRSSSDGVRVRSPGCPGIAAEETGRGGLSGEASPEPFLLRHVGESQKPVPAITPDPKPPDGCTALTDREALSPPGLLVFPLAKFEGKLIKNTATTRLIVESETRPCTTSGNTKRLLQRRSAEERAAVLTEPQSHRVRVTDPRVTDPRVTDPRVTDPRAHRTSCRPTPLDGDSLLSTAELRLHELQLDYSTFNLCYDSMSADVVAEAMASGSFRVKGRTSLREEEREEKGKGEGYSGSLTK
ncbi:hypothetical protein EYF80_017422 [Liparis tanakae]|uniref:Uncharacterized protein n=1 Tax=Liparis tanakae TaxID=230148 RepID=A0A4Z2I581_9TELE|nr:hypothetical protein EYF80_017422 [Liparis tanakae]